MKKITKALLISTALLAWAGGENTILAMQDSKAPVDLSIIEVPQTAKASEITFFQWLDTLKDGQNDSVIEGAKREYTTFKSPAHLAKIRKAVEYLKTVKVATQAHSEELTKSRTEAKETQVKLKEISEEKQKIEQEKETERKVFQEAKGMTFEQMNEFISSFISNLQKSLSGFSDALFLMKFSGDTNDEFSSTLTAIIKQAEASKKMKDAFTEDKKIQKLEIYLQLPKGHVDTNQLVEHFKQEQQNLFVSFSKNFSELEGAISQVKAQFEHIETMPEFVKLPLPLQKKFKEYRYGRSGKGEDESYIDMFNRPQNAFDLFNQFLFFLKNDFATPGDFKTEFEAFLKTYAGQLSAVFSDMIGEIEAGTTEQGLAMIESQLNKKKIGFLSLYRYLNLQLAALAKEKSTLQAKAEDIEIIETHIQKLMALIDFVRIRTFELANVIEEATFTSGYNFVIGNKEDKDLVRGRIYLEKNEETLNYALIAFDGKVIRGTLPIHIADFELKTVIPFKPQILAVTSKYTNTGVPANLGKAKILLDSAANYAVIEGENALLHNLKPFIEVAREQWIDYNLLKEFKMGSDREKTELKEGVGKFSENFEVLSVGRREQYIDKKSGMEHLSQIMQSNLFENLKKDLLMQAVQGAERNKKEDAENNLKNHLTNMAYDEFSRKLREPNKVLEESLKVLGEKISTRDKRDEENLKIQEYNTKNPHLQTKKELLEPPPLTLDNMELTYLVRSQIGIEPTLEFDAFWQSQATNPQSPIHVFLNKLFLQKNKDEFRSIGERFFKWAKAETSDKKFIVGLAESIITAHDLHVDFIKKMKLVKTAFEKLKGDLPDYNITQQSIEAKVRQLKFLLDQNPGVYLSFTPEERAVNYVYNFPMFSDDALKPLKPEMDIWGNASKASITQLMTALKNAYTAYQKARDAIVAINPEAKDRGRDAKLFGGFDEDIQ